ncbi:type IV secretory system conjugative DNA transfer family protein [Aeromonas veronii]|uniref:type IV secretory system conjugative DNA transfer family protein n=1 Tax=Aeromonas veronii TaxID=654 RepID=UPI00187FAD42|nr:IcmO-like type IV secretion system protein [Aeromonas veronii]MBE8745347.1 IcmO-like type IV secretion system protein [Aeromonas veronii]
MAIRGVEKNNMMERQKIFRDVRPWHIQFAETLRSVEVTGLIYVTLIGLLFFMPASFEMVLFLSIALYPLLKKTEVSIAFRKRMSLHEIDEGDLHPGTGKPQKSRGIAYIGNRKLDGSEIWAANDDLRTHMFIVGSTGAGKTEGLISLVVNPLCWGSGFSYADGKGDVSFWGKAYSLARDFGREDDVLVINYMTGGGDTTKKRVDKLSNTYNPYQLMNADSSIQLTTSLMDASGAGGDMWKGRAISFLTSVVTPLTELRDQGALLLHIGRIREYMPFLRYVELMNDSRISQRSQDIMKAFLSDVPGYNPAKTVDKQSSTFLEQFGYQQMQFTRIMSSLADTYGHIFATEQAEVNLKDVAINCRILLVLLPALEKSRPELGNLGKIIVAGMKNMMGTQLGGRIQGSKLELLDKRATNAPSPYLMIFDEFGYFMPEDTALMWAQARSLGFCLVAAGQDIQAFYRTSREETLAIFGSSNLKILGKLEDPTDTYDLFSKLAGEAYVTELDGYELNTNSAMGDYKTNQTAKINRVSRLDILDLKDQIEGEVHVFFKSDIIRARMFYAAPKLVDNFMPNHFIEVIPPEYDEVTALSLNPSEIMEALKLADTIYSTAQKDNLSSLIELKKTPWCDRYGKQKQGAEKGISLFLMLHNPEKYLQQSLESDGDGGSSAAAVVLNNTPQAEDGRETEPTPSHCEDAAQPSIDTPAAEDDAVELDVASMPLPAQDRQAGKPDAITQAFVDGAAPLLSLLFDNQEAKNSAVEDLREAAVLAGYQASDADAVVEKYETTITPVKPDDDVIEQGPEQMESALAALESIF